MKYLKLVEKDTQLVDPKLASYSVYHSEESGAVKYYKRRKKSSDMVDLGLPSGIKWAKYNVGATSETDYGLYFAWGDTQGFSADELSEKFDATWYATRHANTIQIDITPDSGDDAVRVNMGGSWRLPTADELRELTANTIMSLETINEVEGTKFTNKSDSSKYIFIPFAGQAYKGSVDSNTMSGCWSSTYSSSDFAYMMVCTESKSRMVTDMRWRYTGYSLRGVCE